MKPYIYLDYHASTPVDQRVMDAMIPYFTKYYGNSSGSHVSSWQAKEAIDQARRALAKILSASEEEIYFTSSATEANNWVFHSVKETYSNEKKSKVLLTPIEHKSVSKAAEKFFGSENIIYVNVDNEGQVDLEDLEKKLAQGNVILTSIMHGNNEIGSIQNIEKIGGLCKKYDSLFHSDCVQTFAKEKIDLSRIHVHYISWSAHKFYGPKGVGGLYIKDGTHTSAFIVGGGHEFGLRAGTSNTPGIVGMSEAATLSHQLHEKESKQITELRDYLQEGLSQVMDQREVKYVWNANNKENKLYNNLSLSFKNRKLSEMQSKLRLLCYSTGSACSTGKGEPSHVLKAIGLEDDYIRNTMRISLGRMTTKAELDKCIEIFTAALSS